ncbi:hypothetical protein ACFX10_008755 [Malus domestica]
MKFTWTIENFTRLNTKKLYSDIFLAEDYKWRVLIFPKGNDVDFLSAYLDVADSESLPYGWSRIADFSLTVVNQIHRKDSMRETGQEKVTGGFTRLISLAVLCDPCWGFLLNDIVVIEAEVADNLTLKRLSAAEELLKSTLASAPSAEALAALDTVSLYSRSSLATLCSDAAYEEFTSALKLLTEQGMIPLSITSMLKNLLESLEREIPKYVAAEKELTPAEEFVAQFEVMKVQLGRAMQTCEEKKDIVANYDAKIAELEAELARAKGKRAGAMANLKTAVDEMEPLKQSFTDSSSKSESFYVKQATLTAQKGVPAGIWVVIQDVPKKYFKF